MAATYDPAGPAARHTGQILVFFSGYGGILAAAAPDGPDLAHFKAAGWPNLR
jgi:hypothetical protein